MSSGRQLICALVAGLSLLADHALGYLPAPYGGQLVAPLRDWPLTFDPARATRASELQLCALLYDTLFVRAGTGRQRPHLAARWPDVSADARSWRIPVRQGVLLHDGRTLTAADVAASLLRARAGEAGYLLSVVETATVEGDAVVVRLRRPTPELPLLLTSPTTAVAVRSGTRWLGTGAFVLAGSDKRELRLRANLRHFAGRPHLDELAFRRFDRSSAEVASFQVGTVQVSYHGTSVFGGTPRYRPEQAVTPPTTTLHLAVGRGKPFLADADFRAGLLAGIDRDRLKRVAGGGARVVARGPVSGELLTWRAKPARFDRNLAQRQLKRAGRRHPELGRGLATGRLSLSLMVDASRLDDKIVAGQLVADLDRIHIAARVVERSAADYQRRLARGDYELAVARVVPPVDDGGVAIAASWAAAGDRASARRCMVSARCGSGDAKRFAAQLPWLPLLHAGTRVHFDARLGGFRPRAGGSIPYARVYWRRKP